VTGQVPGPQEEEDDDDDDDVLFPGAPEQVAKKPE
jgi:hypothetical protein